MPILSLIGPGAVRETRWTGRPPVLVAIFIFGIDFGGVMLFRIVLERKFYLERWWSFRIGDSIGLPVYAGFAAVVVSEGHFAGFYTQLWWHVLAFVAGYVIALGLQLYNLKTGFFTWRDMITPSELYHTGVFGLMFYLLVTVMVQLVTNHEPTWATVLAFVGLGVYVLTVTIDQSPIVDKTLPPEGRKEEVE